MQIHDITPVEQLNGVSHEDVATRLVNVIGDLKQLSADQLAWLENRLGRPLPLVEGAVGELTLSEFDFGVALKVLRSGGRVARKGWNGKGMWLQYVDHYALQATLPAGLRLLPWIGMKTADGGFVPWLTNQTDALATDWQRVK